MIMGKTTRRVLTLLLMGIGAVLIYLATEVLVGIFLMALGLVIEVVGITFHRK